MHRFTGEIVAFVELGGHLDRDVTESVFTYLNIVVRVWLKIGNHDSARLIWRSFDVTHFSRFICGPDLDAVVLEWGR